MQERGGGVSFHRQLLQIGKSIAAGGLADARMDVVLGRADVGNPDRVVSGSAG